MFSVDDIDLDTLNVFVLVVEGSALALTVCDRCRDGDVDKLVDEVCDDRASESDSDIVGDSISVLVCVCVSLD